MTDSNPFVRLYHPSLNSWTDVPKSQTESWEKTGWTTAKPEKFHDDVADAIPVGDGSTPVTDGYVTAADNEPSGNASTDEWRQYAIHQGASAEDVDGKTRNELRDEYGATNQSDTDAD